ncbi:hypothetical protein DERP_010371 [Dermatophagoides pteronyssinus]|uniref:Uncharacterized protein n=1 Tax=Dermatophagoides pteronyssinus TaxID=6956 RepID=A0ABQ8IZJ7_DERPT|nr:hypothetical protein DERP_010371 [Dermatophagoides pteronyssinus]
MDSESCRLVDKDDDLFFSSSSTNALIMSFIVILSRDVKRSARRSNDGRGNNDIMRTHLVLSFSDTHSDSKSSNLAVNNSLHFRRVPPLYVVLSNVTRLEIPFCNVVPIQ